MRVLGISGSLRRDSLNSALLRAAAERLPAGVELVEFEGLREIPPYDADLELGPAPAAVRELREAIRGADAVLVATPESNHSAPGGSPRGDPHHHAGPGHRLEHCLEAAEVRGAEPCSLIACRHSSTTSSSS